MKKKRLLVFHPALAPYRIDFFNSLNEQYDAQFYFFNENLLNQKFDQNKLRNAVKFNYKFLNLGFNLPGRSFRFGAWKAITTEQPDIVICTEYNLINLIIILKCFLSKHKITVYSICDDHILKAESASFLRKISRKIQLNLLTGIILTHHDIIHWYKKKFKRCPSLLEFPIIRKEDLFNKQLEASLPLSKTYKNKYNLKDKKVLLFVGRLVAVKNLERLLDAFHLIHQQENDTILVLVGSGEMEEKLNIKIEHYELQESVVLPGRFEEEELLAWYLAANIFILPSTNETFGAVVNEALLAGCYSLVSDLAGGNSLIKENVNGNTFNPYDINEMAEVILRNLKKPELFKTCDKLKNSRMLYPYKKAYDHFVQDLN